MWKICIIFWPSVPISTANSNILGKGHYLPLIWMLLYIIWKQIVLRISSTINNYRICIDTQEKGKSVLIPAIWLVTEMWRHESVPCTCAQRVRENFGRKGGRTDPKLAAYVHPGMAPIFFFNLMPSSSDTLWRKFTKFDTRVQCNKGFENMYKLGG